MPPVITPPIIIFKLHLDCDGCFRLLASQSHEIAEESMIMVFLDEQLYKKISSNTDVEEFFIEISSYSNRTNMCIDRGNFCSEIIESWLAYYLLNLLKHVHNLALKVEKRFADENRKVSIKVSLNGFLFTDLAELLLQPQDSNPDIIQAIRDCSGSHLYRILKSIYSEKPLTEIVEAFDLTDSEFKSDSFVYVNPNNKNQMDNIANFLPNSLSRETFSGHVVFNQEQFYVIMPSAPSLQTETQEEMAKKILNMNLLSSDRKKNLPVLMDNLYQFLNYAGKYKTFNYYIDDGIYVLEELSKLLSNKNIKPILSQGEYYMVEYKTSMQTGTETVLCPYETIILENAHSFNLTDYINFLIEAVKNFKDSNDKDNVAKLVFLEFEIEEIVKLLIEKPKTPSEVISVIGSDNNKKTNFFKPELSTFASEDTSHLSSTSSDYHPPT